MGKKKAALAVGLCVAIGLCGAGLAACGDKGEGKPKAGEQSNYYLTGCFAYADYNAANDGDPNRFNANATTKSEVFAPFAFKYTNTANVYEVTVKLYSIDTFKVVTVNQAWNGQMNGDNTHFSDEDPGIYKSSDGYPGEKNFGVKANGEYKITLTVSDEGNSIASTRIGDVPALPKPVQSVTLNKTAVVLELNVTTTFQLVPTINPADADDAGEIYYDVDDDSIATVSDEGLITAVAKGEADVTVECGGQTAVCHVIVLNEGEGIPAESVELNKAETTLHVGQDETLEATVTPAVTTDVAVWESSEPTVATVDQEGKITAVAPGTTTVTVTYGTGTAAKTDECVVTVAKDMGIVGAGKTTVLTGWNAISDYDTAYETGCIFTEGENKNYSLTVDLDNGAAFKILTVGNDWNGELGYAALADEDTTNNINLATQIANDGGNIKILADGNYKIDLIYDTTAETYSVAIERLGDATAEFPWEYDVLIKGSWTGDNNVWTCIKIGTTSFDKDHLTATADVELQGGTGVNFGFLTAPTGTENQVQWFDGSSATVNSSVTTISDGACTASGTYNITVTLDTSGNITSVVFNSFTAAA